MSISMYQASVPVFVRALTNLSNVLKKGEAHAKDRNVEPNNLLQQRLIFDMLPLVKQIQIACDTAARGAARLAGVERNRFPIPKRRSPRRSTASTAPSTTSNPSSPSRSTAARIARW